MKDIFNIIDSLEPLNIETIGGPIIQGKNGIFETLEELSERKIFPILYLEYLRQLEEDNKKVLSKRLLDILLFAKSNITTTAKLHDWMLEGLVPQNSFGIRSMSFLKSDIEKFNEVQKKITENINFINKYEDKLKIKGNKSIQNALNKRKEVYFKYEELIEKINQEIDWSVLLIESKLAAGRKL